jgi:hypothetical protein
VCAVSISMTVSVVFLVAKFEDFVAGCVFVRVPLYGCRSMGMYHVCAHLS